MSRILFLGAGASKPAGYPLTGELLEVLGAEAHTSAWAQFRDAWAAWAEFVAMAPPAIRLVAQNPNPEVVLTLPDLFDLAVTSEDNHRVNEAFQLLKKKGVSRHVELQTYFDSAEREAIRLARIARFRLVHALHWFFLLQHHADKAPPVHSKAYLDRLFANLQQGDVVLTTNWDPLPERMLSKAGRWHPADGYGFPRDIVLQTPNGRQPLPASCNSPSEVLVLKLHGCFGWRQIDDQFFVEGEEFLDVFEFECAGSPLQLRDVLQPEYYQPSDPLAAFPSFLKPLEHPIFLDVWRRAAECLGKASQIVIAGYSLPPSDSALRALLLPLSSRVVDGTVQATVIDRSEDTLRRWGAFLGPRAVLRREDLVNSASFLAA